VERTRLIAHLVDVSDASGRPDPVADYKVIRKELATFGSGIEKKPTIIIATKIDVANPEKLKKLKTFAARSKRPFFAISAVTGEGIEPLKWEIAKRVEALRAQAAEIEVDEEKFEPASAPKRRRTARRLAR
jgi:GTP-binding protein